MTNMYNPPHPGETLKEDVLPALGLTVTEAAKQLGVARPTLSNVLNGHAAISVEMALLLEQWLGEERGGRADFWLAQQSAYALWKGRQSFKTTISRVREGEKRKQTRLETAFN